MFSAALLVGGLVFLLLGAKLLVDGVAALARAAGVPNIVVGLTVVAFGTSTPELVINCISAWKGQTSLAFGNVVGSCAVNIGFVLAVTAIVRPLVVTPSIVTREIPLLFLAVAVISALSFDVRLNHSEHNVLERGDGLVLLLLFTVFLYSIIRQALDAQRKDPFIREVDQDVAAEPTPRIGTNIVYSIIGLIGVAGGGRMAVIGAVRIAEAFEVPQVIIGLTIVSLGTTLPELVTGIMAARKGHSDMAIGNVVGSNLYNLLFIGGAVATINPVPIPAGGGIDLAMMAGLSVLLLPISIRGGFNVTRGEGVTLLVIYLTYAIWRSVAAMT